MAMIDPGVRPSGLSGAFGFLAGAALLLGCSPGAPEIAGVPGQIDYNWHVRPILSENCFQCHGPDPEALKAGLRLDVGELAVRELEDSLGRYAIVPGDSRTSQLVARVTTLYEGTSEIQRIVIARELAKHG